MTGYITVFIPSKLLLLHSQDSPLKREKCRLSLREAVKPNLVA